MTMNIERGTFFPMTVHVYANLDTLRLHPDDLDRALAYYRTRFHQGPAAVGICQCKHNLPVIEKANGMGLPVVHEPGGILGHEIWLFERLHQSKQENNDATQGSLLATTNFPAICSSQNSEVVSRHGLERRGLMPRLPKAQGKRGRPKADLPMKELRALVAKGMGARAVTSELKARGYGVSLRTITRAVSNTTQGVLDVGETG